ncbi:Kinesin-like protein [Melia azedarach]|uniref:Kinesin-like protein n=1 Tax=Melia azedarach TaxID=155640 RepID=A0ACC1WSH4_MELAZ|nr:Kinesin-like protein [Melia azedarach]
MEMKSPPSCPKTVTVRRNPHRKARPTPSTNIVLNPTPSTNLHEISSFPIDEILSMQIPQNPQNNSSSSSSSENLKVYLRVRPLISAKIGDQAFKSRTKNVWPQNPLKKNAVKEKSAKSNRGGDCITINEPHSITLLPPLALQVSKRIKSEVYQGFSYVFSANSSQDEVYEKMVSPLVEDFLKGKSGMLAALGPSGTGKTHTIFGSPREPGMVPIALQRIFKRTTKSCSESSRSFYLSIFEIYSERGKGERMLDLLLDRAELCMQQSTIKGLQEVIISDAAQAESLIARAMLKRATAVTNANSQSSRSQCIINVRCVAKDLDKEDDVLVNDAVLTIVDLAGAEREKRTGNQGARLLESNFINNTSMVFGLCLRSLLEHQKNPKKQLQKHFQNSLLTRYLRDFLEGKKRMTLILTVKSGEEDFLDTSYLLRQASPYMKIKFENVEGSSNLVYNKRQVQSLSRIEQPKRMKFSGFEACSIEEGKSTGEKNQHAVEDGKLDIKNRVSVDFNPVDLAKRERNYQITQKFAKAVWNVLKQYNEKLKVAESEVQSLRKNLSDEKIRNFELEQELKDLKSCCNCFEGSSVEATFAKVDTSLECVINTEAFESSETAETNVEVDSLNYEASECNSTPKTYDSTPRKDQDAPSQIKADVHSPSLMTSEHNVISEQCESPSTEHQDVLNQINVDVHSLSLVTSDCNTISEQHDSPSREHQDVFSQEYQVAFFNLEVVNTSCLSVENFNDRDCQNGSESNTATGQCINQTSEIISLNNEDLNASNYWAIKSNPPNADTADYVASSSQLLSTASTDTRSSVLLFPSESVQAEESPNSSPSSIKVLSTHDCDISYVPKRKPNLDASRKPLNMEKPKRRLLPASSILLRDISALGVEDETEKPKGSRNGKKVAVNEGKRTQGSISLLRLLKNNLNI